MGPTPENYPQTMEQMIASNEARKPKKYTRREIIESNKAEISALVADFANRLEDQEKQKTKVSLRDTERVKQITLNYVRSCQITGTLPTISGIALACGYAPDSFRNYMLRNPDSETTKWIREMKSHFAELLNQASLAGNVAAIPAIFTLKASYGWNDQPEPEAIDNTGDDLSADAVAAKYDDLPD